MNKILVRVLPADPYRQEIVFIYGTVVELDKWCRRKFPNASPITWPRSTRGKYFEFVPANGENVTQVIALVRRKARRQTSVTWLAHECLHCAVAILNAKGIPIRQDTDEVLTYYFQWLFRHCLDYIWP